MRRCASLKEATSFTTSPLLMNAADRAAFARVEDAVRLTRYGGDCYSYCMLAAGHLDLVVETELKPYDIAALIPIITGAGGIVTTWDGKPAQDGGRIIAAGDPRVHEAAMKLLNSCLLCSPPSFLILRRAWRVSGRMTGTVWPHGSRRAKRAPPEEKPGGGLHEDSCALAAGISLLLWPALAAAQDFPDRTIRLIVPFPAGGPNDIIARVVGQRMSELTKQPVVIDNRAGQGGVLGTDVVAKAAPDGYTIGIVSAGALAISPTHGKGAYDPQRISRRSRWSQPCRRCWWWRATFRPET